MNEYKVSIEYKPAYELLVSLETYNRRQIHKMLEIGAAWPVGVRRRLSQNLSTELEALRKDTACEAFLGMDLLTLMVHQCPAGRDCESYLRWLESLAVGELYELLAPHMATVPGNLGELRNRSLKMLQAWHEQYFSHMDRDILAILVKDAAEKSASAEKAEPREFVENVTNGLYLETKPDSDEILLVPQYHFRPFNLYVTLAGIRIFAYPIETVPPQGEPSLRLLTLTRALSDQNRLKLLRMISARPSTFMEIANEMAVAKSTINYHLAVLRAAGLIRTHFTEQDTRYSLRPDAIEILGQQLADYLRQD